MIGEHFGVLHETKQAREALDSKDAQVMKKQVK